MKRARNKLQKVMQQSLGDWLGLWLQRKVMGQRDLAKLLKVSESTVSLVLKGKRKVPKREVERWATSMKLNESESKEFMELAYLSHSPDWVVLSYNRMKEKLERLHHPKG